jgi:hypothetical protein
MNEFLTNLFANPYPQSAADNEWGMSLPVSDMSNLDLSLAAEDEPAEIPTAEDEPAEIPTETNESQFNANDYSIYNAINKMFQRPSGGNAGANFDADFAAYIGGLKKTAQKDLFEGAVLKTVAAGSDLFNQLITFGTARRNIRSAAQNQIQNYENQMTALDNQVLYLKNQLADRFNKTVETNAVYLASRNLRVSGANILELSKESAVDTTDDIRMAESNAELQKIALRTAQKQTKVGRKYAERIQVSNLINSGIKLGLTAFTGGGTGESWGNLWAGYKSAQGWNE